ncbi:histidinol dehydrogenase [Cupriavidus basilensis]
MNENSMENLEIRRLDSTEPRFAASCARCWPSKPSEDEAIDRAVAQILADVKTRGDAAGAGVTHRFDRVDAGAMGALEVSPATLRGRARRPGAQAPRGAGSRGGARARVPREAEDRVRDGTAGNPPKPTARCLAEVTPLDRVSIYVPGGKAAYPSSVLMKRDSGARGRRREIIWWCPRRGGVHETGAGCGAHRRGGPRVHHRRRAGRRCARLRRTDTVPASTRSSAPATPKWPLPSVACSARLALT